MLLFSLSFDQGKKIIQEVCNEASLCSEEGSGGWEDTGVKRSNYPRGCANNAQARQ